MKVSVVKGEIESALLHKILQFTKLRFESESVYKWWVGANWLGPRERELAQMKFLQIEQSRLLKEAF